MLRRILRSRGPEYVIAERREVAEGGEQLRFTDIATAEAFLHRFMPSDADARVIGSLATELRHGVAAPDRRTAVRCVAAALVADRLRVVRRYSKINMSGDAQAREKKDNELLNPFGGSGPALDRDWIEIKLIDQEGNAVAGERYVIVTPDGRESRGYTDSLGMARLTRIPSGQCEVSFPDLDTKSWEPA